MQRISGIPTCIFINPVGARVPKNIVSNIPCFVQSDHVGVAVPQPDAVSAQSKTAIHRGYLVALDHRLIRLFEIHTKQAIADSIADNFDAV